LLFGPNKKAAGKVQNKQSSLRQFLVLFHSVYSNSLVDLQVIYTRELVRRSRKETFTCCATFSLFSNGN